ncbi:MAG: tyrosine-protein kinase [Solirubrobacteraceae bacterium]|nr:tyrosine-protein kinase [Solirubrobacteraceae bacterium]
MARRTIGYLRGMDGPHQGEVKTSTDIRAHLTTLSRWRLVVAICLVTLPTAAYVWSNDKPRVYAAAAQLKVQPSTVDTSLINNFTEVFPGTAPALATSREIITTAVAEEAVRKIPGEGLNAGLALSRVSVLVSPESGIVTLEARGPSGESAARLANAFATTFVAQRQVKAMRLLDTAINRLIVQREQLSKASPEERAQLSEKIQTFRALRASQGNNASIIEPAHPSAIAVSPHPIRTTAIAGLIGLLLALLLVRLLTALDHRVRSEEEVERIMGESVITTVPERSFSSPPGSPAGRHAFETLRANLMFFAIDKCVSSVLVTSPQMGDGKTTVATNLAVSYAQLGRDVIIVDADLRRPQVATKFGIREGVGLTNVLFGEIDVIDALVEVTIDDASGGRLRVLSSGQAPPNPSEMLASSATRRVLAELEEHADVLIIDSPPTTIVSDAIPLLDLVSGVLVVVRLHATDRQRLQRLGTTMRTNEARMLGVALTGVTSRSTQGYGYGYGYGAEAYRAAPSANGASSSRAPAGRTASSRRGRSDNGSSAEVVEPSRRGRAAAQQAEKRRGNR